MKLSEVLLGTKIRCHYYELKPVGWLVGKARDVRSGNFLYCVVFKEMPSAGFFEAIESRADAYYQDSDNYDMTQFCIDIPTMRNTYTYSRWFSDLACDIVQEYPHQKCFCCQIESPHQAPNQDNNYVCDICKVITELQ